uniref:Uncharacterized protein n=1 Tax=Rhizophora mucronata TaxID=61149 RepID=A0A2P2NVP2_RHIMU
MTQACKEYQREKEKCK